tara:strand:+ start:239 stop:2341 length:2103 start_codon:yes stop_codon:yes gene_type:complete
LSTLSQTKKLNFRQGIHRESTQYAEQGSWYDGNRVRFRDKKPENIRGWEVATSGTLDGTGRDLITWQDNITQKHLATGTEKFLYEFQGGVVNDITPVRASVSLTNAFGTTLDSVRVCVSDTAHGLAAGDFAVFSSSSVPTDYSFNGTFAVSIIDNNRFAFDNTTSAGSNESAAGHATAHYLIPVGNSVGIAGTGYGASEYNAETFTSVVLNGKINVVAATVAVSVNSTGHGLEINDFVYFTTATPVGGNIVLTSPTFGGPIFQVVSAEDANNFTINSLVNANATSAAAGVSVVAQFLVSVSTTAGYRTWNSPAVSSGITFEASNWQLDTFGEILLANKRGMGLYQWFPTSGGGARAVAVTNAPVSVNTFIVSPNDRHVVCFGCSNVAGTREPLLVRWSDQNDYTNWTPSISSTSGENTLTGGTKIVQGIRSRNQIAILTDRVLYGMRFTGPPFIFSFSELGTGCGGISQHGGVDLDGTPVWMGHDNFFAFDGRVRRLPCTVRRYVFSDINREQVDKVYAGVNSEFKEVTWLYPSAGSTECDKYVSWSLEENYWVYGDAIWTAWDDRDVFNNVMTTGTSVGVSRIYNNEVPDLFTGKGLKIDSFIESADFGIGDGNEMLFVDRLIPDIEINNGQLSFTIQTKEFPNGTLKTKGPFNVTQSTNTVRFRSRGRQARIKLENNAIGTEWRYGDLRLDIQDDGLR